MTFENRIFLVILGLLILILYGSITSILYKFLNKTLTALVICIFMGVCYVFPLFCAIVSLFFNKKIYIAIGNFKYNGTVKTVGLWIIIVIIILILKDTVLTFFKSSNNILVVILMYQLKKQIRKMYKNGRVNESKLKFILKRHLRKVEDALINDNYAYNVNKYIENIDDMDFTEYDSYDLENELDNLLKL